MVIYQSYFAQNLNNNSFEQSLLELFELNVLSERIFADDRTFYLIIIKINDQKYLF